MRRRLLNLMTALSLLLCVAAVALCVRSYRGDELLTGPVLGSMWSVRHGQLTVYVRPATPVSAARIANDQVQWYLHHEARGFWKRDTGRTAFIAFGSTGAAGALGGYRSDGTPVFTPDDAATLLRALESADSFVAAHVRLAELHQTDGSVTTTDRPDGACVATVDGLRVVLRPVRRYANNRRNDTVMYTASAEVDSTQLPTIRDLWMGRLAAPTWSMSLSWVIAAAAVAPIVTVTRQLRRFARRRNRHCPECGYDLRATPERCPECGATAGTAVA